MHTRSTALRAIFRAAPPIALVAMFAWFWANFGLPVSRTLILGWCLVAIVVLTRCNVKLLARGFVRDWLPFAMLLLGYDFVRGQADRLFEPHMRPQLWFDNVIGAGTAPTVRLQHLLHQDGVTHWYDIATLAVYMSHFLVPFLVAVWLFSYRNELFRRYLWTFVALTLMALATYAAVPGVPPWMAANLGNMPDIARTIPAMLNSSDLHVAAMVWEAGEGYANPVAALPSLHAAYPGLLFLLYYRHSRALALLTGAYAIAMGTTLVYTGEHFVFDVLLGWSYAFVAVLAVDRAIARRARRFSTNDENVTALDVRRPELPMPQRDAA